MPRIELPKDNWAELREPDEVSERGRRPILSAITRVTPAGWEALKKLNPEEVKAAVGSGEPNDEVVAKVSTLANDDLAALQAANDWCIVALVREWSFAQPITIDGALDLPGAAYDLLRDACAPAIETLFVSFEPVVEAGKVDPDSPFVPSTESNGHSKAEISTLETPSPPSGEPISSSSSV